MTTHLVVVDLQQVFADRASPWFLPRIAETQQAIARLVDRFGDATIFTRFVAPAEPRGAWRGYYEQWAFARQPPDAPLYELVAPYAGRPTLDATTFGKWDAGLSERVDPDTDDLVVAGGSTDCCVISTVLRAADAGVAVRVAADACAGASDESHRDALAIMALYAPLVEVTSSAAVLDASSA